MTEATIPGRLAAAVAEHGLRRRTAEKHAPLVQGVGFVLVALHRDGTAVPVAAPQAELVRCGLNASSRLVLDRALAVAETAGLVARDKCSETRTHPTGPVAVLRPRGLA